MKLFTFPPSSLGIHINFLNAWFVFMQISLGTIHLQGGGGLPLQGPVPVCCQEACCEAPPTPSENSQRIHLLYYLLWVFCLLYFYCFIKIEDLNDEHSLSCIRVFTRAISFVCREVGVFVAVFTSMIFFYCLLLFTFKVKKGCI